MRLKLLLLAFLSIVACNLAMAQEVEAPNYMEIRSGMNNPNSDTYYPRLMDRYMRQDTTLTLQQYRTLYYGFTLQEDFVPYQAERDELLKVRSQIAKDPKDKVLVSRALNMALSAYRDNPFSLLAIQTIAFCYVSLEDNEKYNIWNIQKNGILDAIVSSGDGESEESAIHVISIEHEYEVLYRLGLEILSDSLCSDQVEFLKVADNAEDIPGVFFNFSACRKAYAKRYEAK